MLVAGCLAVELLLGIPSELGVGVSSGGRQQVSSDEPWFDLTPKMVVVMWGEETGSCTNSPIAKLAPMPRGYCWLDSPGVRVMTQLGAVPSFMITTLESLFFILVLLLLFFFFSGVSMSLQHRKQGKAIAYGHVSTSGAFRRN